MTGCLPVRPSVQWSITWQYCIKTTGRIISTQLNSTQLNFIDERIKTTTDIVIKINTN